MGPLCQQVTPAPSQRAPCSEQELGEGCTYTVLALFPITLIKYPNKKQLHRLFGSLFQFAVHHRREVEAAGP